MANPLTMKRTYRYRLYPTPEQEQKMGGWLERLRWLYNTALSERRNNWKYNKKRIYCNTQITNLPPLKVRKPEYGDIYSQVLQDAIKRLDKAYANFFRRDAENKEVGYRKHKKLGYPRYKTNPSRYRSFGYPQATGFRVLESGRKVRLAGIGNVKLKYPTASWRACPRPRWWCVTRQANGTSASLVTLALPLPWTTLAR